MDDREEIANKLIEFYKHKTLKEFLSENSTESSGVVKNSVKNNEEVTKKETKRYRRRTLGEGVKGANKIKSGSATTDKDNSTNLVKKRIQKANGKTANVLNDGKKRELGKGTVSWFGRAKNINDYFK